MTYLHCEDCGNVFPVDNAVIVLVEYGYGLEERCACPDCKSTAVAECGTCRICGKVTVPDEDYCGDCKWELRKIWNHAVEDVMGRCDDADFIEAERRFIKYLEDGLGVI